MSAIPVYPFDRISNGETMEVAAGIRWVRMPLPFTLDHINLWLIGDGDGWTIVDTGYNLDEVRDHWRAIIGRSPGGRPIRRTIVTHFHPDHLGLAGWFHDEFGSELWMTFPEWLQAHLVWSRDVTHDIDNWIAFFVANGLDPEVGEAFKAGHTDFGRATTPVPVTFRRIRDGGAVEIGGHDWQVITGAGHSAEHAALYCPGLNVLISGDQVLPRITTNVSLWHTEPDGNPLRQYLDSLEKFRRLPADVLVLPSHGRPFHGLHGRLDFLHAHHRARLDAARDCCDGPRSAMDVVPALFDRRLDEHQIGFAMGESLAHLNYLVADGTLRKYRDGGDRIFYERIA